MRYWTVIKDEEHFQKVRKYLVDQDHYCAYMRYCPNQVLFYSPDDLKNNPKWGEVDYGVGREGYEQRNLFVDTVPQHLFDFD